MTLKAKAWQLLAYAVMGMIFATLLARHALLKAKVKFKYWVRKLYSTVDKRSYRV